MCELRDGGLLLSILLHPGVFLSLSSYACIDLLLLCTRRRHAQRAGARAGRNLHRRHGHMGAGGGIRYGLQVRHLCAVLPYVSRGQLTPHTRGRARLESLLPHVQASFCCALCRRHGDPHRDGRGHGGRLRRTLHPFLQRGPREPLREGAGCAARRRRLGRRRRRDDGGRGPPADLCAQFSVLPPGNPSLTLLHRMYVMCVCASEASAALTEARCVYDVHTDDAQCLTLDGMHASDEACPYIHSHLHSHL
mgnify:CR=1 FL=1